VFKCFSLEISSNIETRCALGTNLFSILTRQIHELVLLVDIFTFGSLAASDLTIAHLFQQHAYNI